MKKLLLLLIAIFALFSVSCAKTRINETFHFGNQELNVEIGIVKELRLSMGDIDVDPVVIYTAESKTYDEFGILVPSQKIIEIIGSSTTFKNRDTTNGEKDYIKVKGLRKGTVELKAYVKDAPNISDVITLNFSGDTLCGLEIITINDNPNNLIAVGEKVGVTIKTYPDTARNNVIYSSSDESVAIVNPITGVITGVGVGANGDGKVVISAVSKYDNTLTAQKEFTVYHKDTEEIIINRGDCIILVNDEINVKVNLEPLTSKPGITYEISNTSIITMTSKENGEFTIKGTAEGIAEIKFKSADGKAEKVLKVSVYVAR